ncbi:MAG: ATP-binding protein [Leptospirales bacterium]
MAANGRIDLRGVDLRAAAVNLAGEYEFYWREFLPPSGEAGSRAPDAFIEVPGAWNSLRLPSSADGVDSDSGEGESIGAEGFATYRLIVLRDAGIRAGLRIPTMHTAYRLFANGVEVSSNGVPGRSRESSRAGYAPRVVEIPEASAWSVAQTDRDGTDSGAASTRRLELLLHISNFQHRKGGTWSNIQIASVDLLRLQRERDLLFDFFLFGSLLIMGLYHVGLFFMRPGVRSPFFFGIFCLLVSLRILTTGEHYLLHMIPDFNWEWYIRLQYWAVYLALPAFGAFAYYAFPREFPRIMLYLVTVIAGAASLFVLFTPVRIFSWSMAYFQVLIALAGVAMLAILVLSLWRGRDGALLYMIGWLCLFATVVNDILNTAEVIQTGYSVPFGFFMFIAMQAIFLALQFARAYETAERMSETLEDRIEERTRELQDSRDQLESAKELAERSDRAKSEFLATMSHEIRTPLNSILGTASLLDESPLSGEQKQQISILNRAGKRLLTLINEILDLSKIEAGKLTLETMPFRVREICSDLQGLMGNRAELKGITLSTNCGSRVPDRCLGDANRLSQVLLNLVGNAIKFTESGGVVLRVEYLDSDESSAEVGLRFSVEDSGIGIPLEKQKRIFESFVQADQSDDRRYEGTGLGLAISRRLVELMGGHLQVKSEPGVGSIFWFEVAFALDASLDTGIGGTVTTRLDADGSAAPRFADRKLESTKSERSPKILLADDNPDNRYLVQVFLKTAGVELQAVENGLEALERAQSEGFDLILMDIQMPVMNGYEAVRAIRVHESETGVVRPTKILALTADATREAYHKAMAAGCDGYLTKPIQKQALLEAIGEYLR